MTEKERQDYEKEKAIEKFMDSLSHSNRIDSYEISRLLKFFKIKCCQCGSEDVGLKSRQDTGACFYEGDVPEGQVLFKCECGQAAMLTL